MTSMEELEVEFYKNGAVVEVYERYELSSEEKIIIRAAINSAKSSEPDMKKIRKSDALLREIAKTREVKEIDTKELSQEELSKFEALTFKPSKKIRSWKWIMIGAVVIVFAIPMTKKLFVEKYYTFQEAKEYCQDKGMVLPNSLKTPETFSANQIGGRPYWSANGGLLYVMGLGEGKTYEKNRVTCVMPSNKINH